MSSGREVHGMVQRTLRDAQARTSDLDARLGQAQADLVRIDAARAKELQTLAHWRVAQLAAPEGLVSSLVETERKARALLDRRDADAAAIQGRLAELAAGGEALARERDAAHDALDAAARRVDEAQAATQARLEADPGYVAQREAAREAERVAVHADEKAAASEAERETKGQAYRQDPLFDYLWRRGFDTPAYRASPLTRTLDRWVARLVGYREARPNYARLVELPDRLREHAETVGGDADAALAALRARDEAALAEDGVPALEAARAGAEAALAAVDEQIETHATARREALQAYERLVAGDDPNTREAVALLASEFGREDLQSLRRAALATPMPEDDAIVARLLDLERDREAAALAVRELKEAAATEHARTDQVEELLRRYTRQGFDKPGTSFPNGALIATMLLQLLSGGLTHDALWRVLAQQRRYVQPKADPTFGSGGFGRGSPWTGGGPRGPSGNFGGTGRAGGFGTGGGVKSGGGFRTGGSVGGRGGFKTGGKF